MANQSSTRDFEIPNDAATNLPGEVSRALEEESNATLHTPQANMDKLLKASRELTARGVLPPLSIEDTVMRGDLAVPASPSPEDVADQDAEERTSADAPPVTNESKIAAAFDEMVKGGDLSEFAALLLDPNSPDLNLLRRKMKDAKVEMTITSENGAVNQITMFPRGSSKGIRIVLDHKVKGFDVDLAEKDMHGDINTTRRSKRNEQLIGTLIRKIGGDLAERESEEVTQTARLEEQAKTVADAVLKGDPASFKKAFNEGFAKVRNHEEFVELCKKLDEQLSPKGFELKYGQGSTDAMSLRRVGSNNAVFVSFRNRNGSGDFSQNDYLTKYEDYDTANVDKTIADFRNATPHAKDEAKSAQVLAKALDAAKSDDQLQEVLRQIEKSIAYIKSHGGRGKAEPFEAEIQRFNKTQNSVSIDANGRASIVIRRRP